MESLCKIRDIYRSIMAFEAHFQHRYAICLNEGMLLCSLTQSPQLSSGEIATLLALTASNASKVIRQAEDKSFIRRILGEADKRQMYFELTEKGRQLIVEIKRDEKEMGELLDKINLTIPI